jgi:hypothetical protein
MDLEAAMALEVRKNLRRQKPAPALSDEGAAHGVALTDRKKPDAWAEIGVEAAAIDFDAEFPRTRSSSAQWPPNGCRGARRVECTALMKGGSVCPGGVRFLVRPQGRREWCALLPTLCNRTEAAERHAQTAEECVESAPQLRSGRKQSQAQQLSKIRDCPSPVANDEETYSVQSCALELVGEDSNHR